MDRASPSPGQRGVEIWRRALRALCVRFATLEFERDERLIADDPRVVPRLNHIGVALPRVRLGLVVVTNVKVTSHHRSDVLRLTGIGARNGLYCLRPTPSGFHPADQYLPRRLDDADRTG